MSCLIPKGATYSKVENGTKILFNNVLYNADDCQIDDEAHLIIADVKEEDAIPKKSKTKKTKPEPKDEDSNMSPRPQEPLQPTQPQPTQPQLQVQPQPTQPQPQYAQPQYAQPQQQYVPPQGFTVPPQFQGYLPPQQIPISETHSETQKPEFDMNIIKQIFDLAGGNPILILGLIAGYLGFSYMKKMDKWKEDENKNGGKHASECDNDRKNISSKITDLELKSARIDQIETKIRQINENLSSRLNKVEEQGSISLGLDTEEIQAQIDTHSKAISNLEKKFTSLNPTTKKNTTTTTKAVKPIAPPHELLDDDE